MWILYVLSSPAAACGGLFCNTAVTPVDQVAETIVFGIDEVNQTVDVHVQITYQGASDDFAWIVPVPSEPELFLSSDALFSALSAPTDPTFQLSRPSTGVCDVDLSIGCSDYSVSIDAGLESDVTVLSTGQVGPYDTVVLEANDADVLVGWLQEAGYDLPNDLEPILAPYVASGQAFVALKLSNGRTTGDLQPLGMRYAGTAASIPIQLTAVAAVPDLPVEVYVLGSVRAVPDNYLHVTLNDAAFDWWNAGANYPEVLSAAVDEAGGHAFVTEWSGSTELFQDQIWSDEQALTMERVGSIEDPIEWIEAAAWGLRSSGALVALLDSIVPFPAELEAQGLTPIDFYRDLHNYTEFVDATRFVAAEATARLEAEVVSGMKEAERLLELHPHATRMTTMLSPEEMTIDPIFLLNADLPQEVSNAHTASDVRHCGLFEGDGAERTLELEDGRVIPLPTANWLENEGLTEFEVLGPLTLPAAILIEDFGDEGLGEAIFDWREEAGEEARGFDRAGCGCSNGSQRAGWLVGTLLVAFRRRRP